MGTLRKAPALALFGLLLGLSPPAHGEICHWTDAEGRLHFTQQLTDVPRELRAAAHASSRQETKQSTGVAGEASLHARSRPGLRRAGGIQVPFEKNGNTMIVYARINDLVTAPFLVDTGASDVLLPEHVARAAGIQVGAHTPQAVYHTANGMIEQPVITLDSVAVGDARVEGVRGSISDGMQVGLLGGSFFNNFTFQVDPGANVITLFPSAEVASGANAEEWRARFRVLRDRIDKIASYLETNQLTDEDRVADLGRRRAALESELEALETEADRAAVPKAWRE